MTSTVRYSLWTIAAFTLCGLAACGGDDPVPHNEAVVDSALPVDTLLSRFREGLERPAAFTGGAASMDALVDGFVGALERRDSTAFRDLAITRPEFAWLYYPHLPEAAPPYELPPDLMWFMIETGSGRGLSTLLEERGGTPQRFVGYRCAGERRHGPVTVLAPCVMRRVQAEGDTVAESLFGPVVSLDGRFKFVSYANKL
jgi:hypothetical protein